MLYALPWETSLHKDLEGGFKVRILSLENSAPEGGENLFPSHACSHQHYTGPWAFTCEHSSVYPSSDHAPRTAAPQPASASASETALGRTDQVKCPRRPANALRVIWERIPGSQKCRVECGSGIQGGFIPLTSWSHPLGKGLSRNESRAF